MSTIIFQSTLQLKPPLISYVYFLFAESTWPRKNHVIHPVIQLGVHHYESLIYPGSTFPLREGSHLVGVDGDYIIGVVIMGHLCPLLAPRADLDNNYGRVKIRINGNAIEPILRRDPLNHRFHTEFPLQKCRPAEVHY